MRNSLILLILLMTCGAAAQHSDIVVAAGAAGLETRDEATGLAARVFESELGELSIPGWTDEPGYTGSTLSSGEAIGFNITGPLLYWDGVDYVAPPENERLDVSLGGTTVATARGDTTTSPGVVFAIASSGGSIHAHLGYWVKHPDFDPDNPLINPITGPGAYALAVALTSDQRGPSLTFYIVFNNGLEPAAFQAAVAAAEDRADPPLCTGDLDGDGAVGIADLSQLLSHFGVTGGASGDEGDLDGDGEVGIGDLALLLGVFGTLCPS